MSPQRRRQSSRRGSQMDALLDSLAIGMGPALRRRSSLRRSFARPTTPDLSRSGSKSFSYDPESNSTKVEQCHETAPLNRRESITTSEVSSTNLDAGKRERRRRHISFAIPRNDSTTRPTTSTKEPQQDFAFLCFDLSEKNRSLQFILCAGGVFTSKVLYGYLKELIFVSVFNKSELALFTSAIQFLGFAFWAHNLDLIQQFQRDGEDEDAEIETGPIQRRKSSFEGQVQVDVRKAGQIPLWMYLFLSLLRAASLGGTNFALKYLNFPAATLLKSCRTLFIMLCGMILGRKKYSPRDYAMVGLLVSGLGVNFTADTGSKERANFDPRGVAFMVFALLCDAVEINLSESLMQRHNMGQDALLGKLYLIAAAFLLLAAWYQGELFDGLYFLSVPGTISEHQTLHEAGLSTTEIASSSEWNPRRKVFSLLLMTLVGVVGSSSSTAIAKQFGSLTSSVTGTAQKVASLLVSFLLFPHKCTGRHLIGMGLFVASFLVKAVPRDMWESSSSMFGTAWKYQCQAQTANKSEREGVSESESS